MQRILVKPNCDQLDYDGYLREPTPIQEMRESLDCISLVPCITRPNETDFLWGSFSWISRYTLLGIYHD